MPIVNGKFVKDSFGPHSISSAYDGPACFFNQKKGISWATMCIPCTDMEKIQILLLEERAEREASETGRPLLVIN